MSKESLAEFFQSKMFAGIVAGVCIMLVVICIFEVGVIVGYHEASFSSSWGENYGRNFGNSNGMPALPDMNLPAPGGILGKIVSVSTVASTTTIVVSGIQLPEEKILIDANTIIRDHENTIQPSGLTVGSYVVVLGAPDTQGTIQAKLIRVVPAPPTN
jgi:hypothetical protein